MVRKVILLVLVVAALVGGAVFVAHKRQVIPIADGKLPVVASFYPLAYFAAQIGGERATVSNITPAGAEPHDYEPSALDIARIDMSRLLVVAGNGLEPWFGSIRQNIDPKKTVVVVAGDGLGTRELTEEGATMTDPHTWLSPPLALRMVEAIARGLMEADPADQAVFRRNAEALEQRLAALDTAYRTGLSQCAKHDIVTSHAAFGYLAAAYGLHQVSIAGLSPDAEPSPQQLIDIAAFARSNDVRYIFFESLVSPKLSDVIASEVGAQTRILDPLEGLSPDALERGEDYFTVMRANLDNLRTALVCP